MMHKTKIGEIEYNINGGKTKIGEEIYNINSGKTLINGTSYDINFSKYDPDFASNTWEQIIEACKNNAVPNTWIVGATKAITLNDTQLPVVIIGKNHDTYDGLNKKAPLTFQFGFSAGPLFLLPAYTGSNVFGWSQQESDMYDNNIVNWFNSKSPSADFARLLNSAASVRKETFCRIRTTVGTTVVNSFEKKETSSKFFPLSQMEIFNEGWAEGTQYLYYATNTTHQLSQIKFFNGPTSRPWNTRSFAQQTTGKFGIVTPDGAFVETTSASACVSAFCF